MVLRVGALLFGTIAWGACSGAEPGPSGDAGAATDAAAAGDGSGPECALDATGCSEDGMTSMRCAAGRWVTDIECMRGSGRLCEAGACVDPWRYGAPVFAGCADDPRATIETLAGKAAYYDALAVRLHLHPDLRWVAGVVLEAGAAETDATWQNVERWSSGENDGLWSSLYLASQAYRWAVTEDPAALETIRVTLAGLQTRMEVTGVDGIFTRQFVPPGVRGIGCPQDLARYVPDVEKDDNAWVQIGDDGCVWVVDRATSTWTATEHCGLGAHSGTCWLDNVSKDEYAGHMFALAALFALVDVPDVREVVANLLEKVADHLIANDLTFVDWDGRRTEHGALYAWALDDYPGFNAAMAMSFVLVAAEATGRSDLRAFYDECLLQKSSQDCLPWPLEEPTPYTNYLEAAGMYLGPDGCRSNFNNISMHVLSMHDLIWFERDPLVRERLQSSFDVDVMRPPGLSRSALRQHNAWFDFLWAASKRLGPGSDGPAYDAVHDGICMLQQFPAHYAVPDVADRDEAYCLNRFDDPSAELPREAAERCPAEFVWWKDPYDLSGCTEARAHVLPPQGYLLPYWMGRYHGFVSEEM